MSGGPDAGNRVRPTAEGPPAPTLEPAERLWIEGYLERLKNAPGGFLKRLVVYGSKARGDAGPASDLDVLVLVGDIPDAAGKARELIYGGDDPGGVDHNVVVRTEADWLRDLEKELPFPRNVEAEGVQIHPVRRPARRPPGDRPPVTRKGIRNAVPVWLKEARSDLKTLAYEIKELKEGRFKHPGMAARPAFDAVFFSAMAWCLTRGVSVVRRRDPGAPSPGCPAASRVRSTRARRAVPRAALPAQPPQAYTPAAVLLDPPMKPGGFGVARSLETRSQVRSLAELEATAITGSVRQLPRGVPARTGRRGSAGERGEATTHWGGKTLVEQIGRAGAGGRPASDIPSRQPL